MTVIMLLSAGDQGGKQKKATGRMHRGQKTQMDWRLCQLDPQVHSDEVVLALFSKQCCHQIPPCSFVLSTLLAEKLCCSQQITV